MGAAESRTATVESLVDRLRRHDEQGRRVYSDDEIDQVLPLIVFRTLKSASNPGPAVLRVIAETMVMAGVLSTDSAEAKSTKIKSVLEKLTSRVNQHLLREITQEAGRMADRERSDRAKAGSRAVGMSQSRGAERVDGKAFTGPAALMLFGRQESKGSTGESKKRPARRRKNKVFGV